MVLCVLRRAAACGCGGGEEVWDECVGAECDDAVGDLYAVACVGAAEMAVDTVAGGAGDVGR